ncbi:MAG: asparagine synthase-related protein [Anaerolineae bacterium]
MSGLVLIYNRDGSPVDRAVLQGMMGRLAHRGPDGSDVTIHPGVALGHQHFWTTPEELGERQPLLERDGRLDLVFDGRLDNRGELLAALDLNDRDGREMSDSMIVLRAYQRWGEDCFERLLGPFAVVIYDAPAARIICARDPLCDRTLFYYLDERELVVASEGQAILAHPAVSERLDETTLALHFAVRVPEDGATFLADVRELLPAHVMVVEATGVRTWRYWAFDGSQRLRYRSDAEYGEHYQSLLEESVACRLRSVTAPTVLMSGGLDSTSVAATAAQLMAYQEHAGPLHAISWVFEELSACDERAYMDTMVARYDIEAHRFCGDGFWPLRDAETWPWSLNGPDGNPYRRLMHAAYSAAREAGARVVLSGWFGDHQYTGAETWLADLLAELRWREAAREMLRHLRHSGPTRVLNSGSVRHLGRRILDSVPGGRRLRPEREAALAPWLTPYAAALVAGNESGRLADTTGRRWEQVERMLGARAARGASGGASDVGSAGVEIWYPYRDRRLVEFALAVPGHQLYSQGRYKHVLRSAMAGLLPEEIRRRSRPTSLLPLYARGLLEREWATVQELLWAPDAVWPRYVSADYLETIFPARIESGIDGLETVLPWQCLSFELWRLGAEARRQESRPVELGVSPVLQMFEGVDGMVPRLL